MKHGGALCLSVLYLILAVIRPRFKEEPLGWLHQGLHKTEIEFTDLTETFASLKSCKFVHILITIRSHNLKKKIREERNCHNLNLLLPIGPLHLDWPRAPTTGNLALAVISENWFWWTSVTRMFCERITHSNTKSHCVSYVICVQLFFLHQFGKRFSLRRILYVNSRYH